MALRYWVGGSGSWSATNTTNWSATSGGTGGATVPGAEDLAIFDSNSGSGNYTVTKTSSTTALGIRMSNPASGVLTYAGTSATTIGAEGILVQSGVVWTNTGLLTVNSAGQSLSEFSTSGATITSAITLTSSVVPFTGSVATTGALTITNSTISLGSYNLTGRTLSSSSTTGTRVFNFGTGVIRLTSTSAETVITLNGTNATVTGNPIIELTGVTANTRTITMITGFTESNAFSVYVKAGSGAISTGTTGLVARDFDFTGSTCTWSPTSSAVTIYGSLILSSAGSTSLSADSVTLSSSTSTTKTIDLAGKTISAAWTIVGEQSTWSLANNISVGSALSSNLTFTSGTLELNNYTIAAGNFLSNNSNNRQINFGSSGKIVLNRSTSTWNTANTSNLTISGTPLVEFTTGSSSTSITVNSGTPTESNAISFKFSLAGATSTQSVNFTTGSVVRDIDFSGTGRLGTAAINVYGNLALSSNVSLQGTGSLNLLSSQSGKTVSTSGKALTWPVTFNGSGSWSLSDAFNIGTNALTLNKGTLNTNGFNVTAGSVQSLGTETRQLQLGASAVTLNSADFWNVTTTGFTLSSGTSTITASNAAPVLNGSSSFYNMTFSSAAVTGITINGQNSFNNLTFTHPDTVGCAYVTFGGNQTIAGALSVNGSSTANARLVFASSTLGTQRTITAASATGLDDIDFRDIAAAGSSTPWTGTRLGNARNNTNITFAEPKTVYTVGTASSLWTGDIWTTQSGGSTPEANAFPLPQDSIVSSGLNTLTINGNFNIGNLSLLSGNFGTSTNTPTFVGNLTLSDSVGTVSGTGIFTFYGSSTSDQTITINNEVLTQPVVINTAGVVKFGSNFATNNYIRLTKGSLNTQNYNVSALYLESNTTETRTINLGSSTVTLSSSAGTSQGLVLNTTGLTINPGTSTIAMSGTTFGIISTGNLTLNNLSFTSGALTNVVIGSSSYVAGTSPLSAITIAGNNFTVAARTTTFSSSVITFTGVSSYTLSGAVNIGPNTVATQRTAITSFDLPLTLSSATVGTLSDVDFSGIAVTGASSPWTGTRLGNGGRNSGITFPSPKTVYWSAIGLSTYNWYSTGWATTLGGTPAAANLPLPQDTAVFTDQYPGSGTTINIQNNFMLPAIDFSERTLALSMTTAGTMVMPGNLNFYSGLNWSGSGTLVLSGSGTQTVNTAGKSITQALHIAASGEVTLSANLTCTNAAGISLDSGTFNANGYNIVATRFNSLSAATRSLKLGTGTWTISGIDTTVPVWDILSSANMTVQPSTSTITLTGNDTKTFRGSGLTYGTLNINSTGTTSILGNNTFTTINNSVAPVTILFEGGSTQTLSGFDVNGTAPSTYVTVGSTTTTNATLRKATLWYVGANSIDGGNNTGLIFTSGGNIDYLNLSYITGTGTTPPPVSDGIVITPGITVSGGISIS